MRSTFFLCMLVLFVAHTAFAQQRIYLAPAKLINVHPDYAESVSSLFRTYGEEGGRYIFLMPEPTDSLPAKPSMSDLFRVAEQRNADLLGKTEMNRIGETVIISFHLYDLEHGEPIWSDRMEASSPDDLLPIIKRMAGSIGTDQKASANNDIYNVTEEESQELKKVRSSTSFGLSIGGGPLLSHSLERDSPAGFGLRISNDARQLIFDIVAEAYFSDYTSYMIGLDILKPMNSKNNAPYVNGGMSFGGGTLNQNVAPQLEFDERVNSGLTLHGGGGYLLNRRANTRLFLGVRGYFSMFKIENKNPAGAMLNTTIVF